MDKVIQHKKRIQRLISRIPFWLLTGMLLQCVRPEITADKIVLWRDIQGLNEIHAGRFAWGRDRLVQDRLDTIYTATASFQLMAREINPTTWVAQNGGCLVIPAGIDVTLGFFQFRGVAPTDTLIIVDGGSLELIGCDIYGPAGGGIIVRNGGQLTLSQSRIQDITQPVMSRNSTIDLKYVQIRTSRGTALEIQGGAAHRIKGLDISNIDGSGVVIRHTGDVRFNQVKITAVSQDGIHASGIEQLRLDSIQVQKAGGHGLLLNDIQNLSISDTKISESGQQGLGMTQVNQSYLMRVASTRNGDDGLRAALFDTLKITNTLLYKNGRRGGAFDRGIHLDLGKSVSSENQWSGLRLQDVNHVILDSVQVKLNQVADSTAGIFVSDLDSLTLQNSQIQFNVGAGLIVDPMPLARLLNNSFYKNVQAGALARSLGNLFVSENSFAQNQTGLELVGIQNIDHRKNVYTENGVGLTARASNLKSEENTYSGNTSTGVELLDSRFEGYEEALHGNRFGLTGVGGSLVFHDGYLTGNQVGIFVKGSPVNVQETRFEGGETGIQLTQVTTGLVQHSRFTEQSARAIHVEGSATVILTNNAITQTPLGANLKANDFVNFSRNEITNASHAGLVWDGMDNGVIRYNLMVRNKSAVWVKQASGFPAFENNTLVTNGVCFQDVRSRDLVARYNIFMGNDAITHEAMGPNPGSWGTWEYNCLWENGEVPQAVLDKKAGNFIADPVFQQQYYLKSASPCLEVGPERRLAGARGLTPAIKPQTE